MDALIDSRVSPPEPDRDSMSASTDVPPTDRLTATDPSTRSPAEEALIRFFGQVQVDPERYARDMGNIQREVIDRLAGSGATLDIIIDIKASKPDGFTETEVRTISENARTLRFDPSGLGFSAD
jgi:hypothetical protein